MRITLSKVKNQNIDADWLEKSAGYDHTKSNNWKRMSDSESYSNNKKKQALACDMIIRLVLRYYGKMFPDKGDKLPGSSILLITNGYGMFKYLEFKDSPVKIQAVDVFKGIRELLESSDSEHYIHEMSDI